MTEVTTGPEGNKPPDGAAFHLGWEFAPPRCGSWYLEQGRGGVQHLFWVGPANKLERSLTKEIRALMQTQRAFRAIQTGHHHERRCYAPILQGTRGDMTLYYICRLAPFGSYVLDDITGAIRWHELPEEPRVKVEISRRLLKTATRTPRQK
jgi:hypothetical protein